MNKTKIMLVMRPTTFRDDLILQMGHEGFEVILASEGHDALDKIRRYSVDEVVTQLNLPQFDGLELILSIKDLRMNIPIIVISFEDSEMQNEVLQAGAAAFLHYPADPATVIDLIRHNARAKNEIKKKP